MKSVRIRASLTIIAVATIALASTTSAYAQSKWPSKPITIIVPFSAGGSADRTARNIAPYLGKELGTSIVVQNRPGASGEIGTTQFLAKPADANTILLSAQPYFTASVVLQGAQYSLNDLEILNVHELGNISLTVKADSKYNTFADLNQAIKDRPGKISMGTVRGGASELLALLLKDKLGWKDRIVTYNSGAPVRTALLGGHITSSTNGAVSDAAMKPGVRSLAMSTSKGIAAFPHSPYINDVLKKYNVKVPEIGDVRFLAVKAGTQKQYPQRYKKLLSAYKTAMNNKKYRKLLKQQSAADETAYRGPEKSTQIVRNVGAVMRKYQDAFKK